MYFLIFITILASSLSAQEADDQLPYYLGGGGQTHHLAAEEERDASHQLLHSKAHNAYTGTGEFSNHSLPARRTYLEGIRDHQKTDSSLSRLIDDWLDLMAKA